MRLYQGEEKKKGGGGGGRERRKKKKKEKSEKFVRREKNGTGRVTKVKVESDA